jgi:hypothetical protein
VLPLHFDKLFKLFIYPGYSNELSGSRFLESFYQALLQSSWLSKRDKNGSIVANQSRKVKHLGSDMRKRQKGNLPNLILKVLDKSNRWALLIAGKLLLLIF